MTRRLALPALVWALAAAAPRADADARPELAVFPASAAPGAKSAPGELDVITQALRLGAAESGRFRVLTAEEMGPRFGSAARIPGHCFSALALPRCARRSRAPHALAAEVARGPGDTAYLRLVLLDTAGRRVRALLAGRTGPVQALTIDAVKGAALRLIGGAAAGSTPGLAAPPEPAPAAPDTVPSQGRAGTWTVLDTAQGDWTAIPWLNRRAPADHRKTWSYAGSGLLAAGVLMAYVQGQLLQEDENDRAPSRNLLSGGGASSFLRGFFAAPTLGAQYAALGGAGSAHVDDALAVLLNPAGVADAARQSAVAAKRSLPGGVPSFFLAYAGPLRGPWHQGLGVQYEGDGLANETTFLGAVARDWGALGHGWDRIKTGAGLKLYLAKVGAEGTGLERSTGHSFGMGLDLGLRVRLSERITAGFMVRDAGSFLRHSNTFTGDSYTEVLPPEWRLGAAYRVSEKMFLVMDGQKSAWADQADHLRLGGERMLFGLLAVRAGLHEIYGREEVRKLSLGFGLNTDGIGDSPLKQRLALDYAYEFGLDEDEPLGGGQQFSLEVSF